MLFGLENIDFGAIERSAQAPLPQSLTEEASEALRVAKLGTAALVALQAVAAFSALGIVAIQWKTYAESRRKKSKYRSRSRRSKSRRSGATRYVQLNRGRRARR